jgi:hypothetical protein
MPNSKQTAARRLNMADRAAKLMEIHFPAFPKERIWHRKQNDGFTTLPRTLPIVLQVIDEQSKGQPAGHTLFCLWSRSPDHSLLAIDSLATFAAEAGFKGKRAIDTWRRRMKLLRSLGFILTKEGASGEFHYVLLLNPNVAVEVLRQQGKVQDLLYGRFRDRLIEVGGYGEIEAFEAFQEKEKAGAGKQSKASKKPLKKTPAKAAKKP